MLCRRVAGLSRPCSTALIQMRLSYYASHVEAGCRRHEVPEFAVKSAVSSWQSAHSYKPVSCTAHQMLFSRGKMRSQMPMTGISRKTGQEMEWVR